MLTSILALFVVSFVFRNLVCMEYHGHDHMYAQLDVLNSFLLCQKGLEMVSLMPGHAV